MSFSPVTLVSVFFHEKNNKSFLGRLLFKERRVFFEYDSDFLRYGCSLSPFKLPLKSGVFEPQESVFGGLFGLFNDSLPDGWGHLLLERKLIKAGLNPGLIHYKACQ